MGAASACGSRRSRSRSELPILKAYLRRAPGARPHIAVDKDAPLAEFAAIAQQIPVFRVLVEA